MPTYSQLMEILKANEISGYSHYTKSKLVDLLGERGLMPEKCDTSIQEKSKKDIDPKYIFLRQIHKNPKKVEIMIWKQMRLLYSLLYTRLLWSWVKIPE